MLRVEPLDPRRHDRSRFDCGTASLDEYLQQHAARHMESGISATHVLVDPHAPAAIIGYYSAAAAQLLLSDLQEGDRRRLPRYPVPAMRIGRLAVHASEHSRGHGAFLLADAVSRALALRTELGLRVLIVDALDERACAFYRAFGFRDCTTAGRTLYLSLGAA